MTTASKAQDAIQTVSAQEPDTLFGREPARVIGAAGTVASAVITLLVTLGVGVPDGLDAQVQDAIQALGALVTIIIPLYVGNRTRAEVVPTAKIAEAARSDALVTQQGAPIARRQ